VGTDGYLGSPSFRGCAQSVNPPIGTRRGGRDELSLSSFLGGSSHYKLYLGFLQSQGLALDRGDRSRSGVVALGPVAVL